MRDPRKIKVIGEAEDLAVLVYKLTKHFPPDERFGLISQMRRASVSTGSNIVEGCHRDGARAFRAFLFQALGSVAELAFQLRIATRLDYGTEKERDAVRDQAERVKAMLIRLIASLRVPG